MAPKMSARLFAEKLTEAWQRKDGYIMGAHGQDPKTGRMYKGGTPLRAWLPEGYYYAQYTGLQHEMALYWRENAARVWDCNGLAEGIYELHTGKSINARVHDNYHAWCEPKGEGVLPYRLPGAAVFKFDPVTGKATHVAFLTEPIDKNDPAGDWYVVEARGVMTGVSRAKLSERSFERWGLMTRYFDYDISLPK